MHFPVLHFPVLLFGPPNSSPAFSSPAIWSAKFQSCIFQPCYLVRQIPVLHFPPLCFSMVRHFPVLHFQSPQHYVYWVVKIVQQDKSQTKVRMFCYWAWYLWKECPNGQLKLSLMTSLFHLDTVMPLPMVTSVNTSINDFIPFIWHKWSLYLRVNALKYCSI